MLSLRFKERRDEAKENPDIAPPTIPIREIVPEEEEEGPTNKQEDKVLAGEARKEGDVMGERFGLFAAENMGDTSLINFSCIATTTIKVPVSASDLLSRPDEFISREIMVEPRGE